MATKHNENNDIGVPLTLLALEERHRFAVLELGASRRGDIDRLARLARPHVALVTNALPAHLAGFGSVAEVAAGKGELYQHIESDGIGVVNLDSEHAETWRRMAMPHRIVTYSSQDRYADCFACDIERMPHGGSRFSLRSPNGMATVGLSLLGRHNVANALAAAAAAYACGIDLEAFAAAMEGICPPSGRMQTKHAADGLLVIDDSYNANPASMRAAIKALAFYPPPRALVVGDMVELGPDAARLHSEVGAYAREQAIDGLFSCGEHSADVIGAYGSGGHGYADCDALLSALRGHRHRFGVFLVKGSRSTGMERAVQALLRLNNNADA